MCSSDLKVRRNQKPGDYSNPGWYEHPEGTVAREWTGPLAEPARSDAPGSSSMPPEKSRQSATQFRIRNPGGDSGHGNAGH